LIYQCVNVKVDTLVLGLNWKIMDRVESRCLMELRALLKKANDLYSGSQDDDSEDDQKENKGLENSDAIKLLDTIGDLENKIRIEEYKEDLLNGDA
jgi:hypothetical protein